MTPVGMIHMKCHCQAILFCFGEGADADTTSEIVERFLTKLRPGRYGVFGSDDGPTGVCPHCGQEFELPGPELMSRLPFLDPAGFRQIVAGLRSEEASNEEEKPRTVLAQHDLSR